MKIKSIKIHNFRSIKEMTFNPYEYSVMLGANNAGKSNVITALRVFYEDDIKFSNNVDFPKFNTDDDESWIDIEYLLTNDEYINLDSKYQNPGNILKIRKYLQHEDKVISKQSNLYGYEKAKLSDNLFYGWKTKGQSKLGNIIYIPEVTKADDTMKLTAPSTLREIVTFVMKKVVKNSDSYSNLNTAFESFNEKFKEEASKEGFSLKKFKEEINESLKEWEIEFDLDINPIRPEDIIKNLISHHTIDKNLDAGIDVKNLGQGLQRHLIYTMLRLSAQYVEKKEYKKKEFAPSVTGVKHIHNVGIKDKVNNNVLERLNGTVREREKIIRGLKKEDTPILKGQRIFYNYIRPHQALGGATPSQIAGVELNLGENKWLNLMKKSLSSSIAQ